MVALPGLTTTSLTKDRTKALVSVSSLVLRNSLISPGEGGDVVGAVQEPPPLPPAAPAPRQRRPPASPCAHGAPWCNPAAGSPPQAPPGATPAFWRYLRATPSISSSTSFFRIRMFLLVRILSRICSAIRPSTAWSSGDAYSTALAEGKTFRIEGNRLEILDGERLATLVFVQ